MNRNYLERGLFVLIAIALSFLVIRSSEKRDVVYQEINNKCIDEANEIGLDPNDGGRASFIEKCFIKKIKEQNDRQRN